MSGRQPAPLVGRRVTRLWSFARTRAGGMVGEEHVHARRTGSPRFIAAAHPRRVVAQTRPSVLPVAFVAAIGILTIASFVPPTNAILGDAVWDPIRAQLDPGNPALAAEYSALSLAVWGVLAALGLGAYWELAQRRPDALEPRTRTLLLAAPLLAWGPIAHALLAEDALPDHARLLATEPVVYATVAALLFSAGIAGHALRNRPGPVAIVANGAFAGVLSMLLHTDAGWGVLAAAIVSAFAAAAAVHLRGIRGRDAGIAALGAALLTAAGAQLIILAEPTAVRAVGTVLALALGLAVLGWGTTRVVAKRAPGLALATGALGFACFAGHALDASTTWLGVVDPFGWGLGAFSEKNPVSAALLAPAMGLPFIAAKLLLPAVALYAAGDVVREDAGEGDGGLGESGADDEDAANARVEAEQRARERHGLRLLIAFGIFVLGFGPGAANLARMAVTF